jgi:hypothetical protein
MRAFRRIAQATAESPVRMFEERRGASRPGEFVCDGAAARSMPFMDVSGGMPQGRIVDGRASDH